MAQVAPPSVDLSTWHHGSPSCHVEAPLGTRWAAAGATAARRPSAATVSRGVSGRVLAARCAARAALSCAHSPAVTYSVSAVGTEP